MDSSKCDIGVTLTTATEQGGVLSGAVCTVCTKVVQVNHCLFCYRCTIAHITATAQGGLLSGVLGRYIATSANLMATVSQCLVGTIAVHCHHCRDGRLYQADCPSDGSLWVWSGHRVARGLEQHLEWNTRGLQQ